MVAAGRESYEQCNNNCADVVPERLNAIQIIDSGPAGHRAVDHDDVCPLRTVDAGLVRGLTGRTGRAGGAGLTGRTGRAGGAGLAGRTGDAVAACPAVTAVTAVRAGSAVTACPAVATVAAASSVHVVARRTASAGSAGPSGTAGTAVTAASVARCRKAAGEHRRCGEDSAVAQELGEPPDGIGRRARHRRRPEPARLP
jgi:hypothetical protein